MKKDWFFIVLGILLVGFLVIDGLVGTPAESREQSEPLSVTEASATSVAESSAPIPVTASTEATGASTAPTSRPTETTEAATQPTTAPTQPVPIYGVDESYFDDALFIGDSLSTGLRDCARLGDADYFAVGGMGIFTLFGQTASDWDFPEQSLISLLSTKSYGKIYFTLGINDSYQTLDAFRTQYSYCIQRIRELQPDAILILGCNLPVSREFSASASCFSLEHQTNMNQIIRSFADDETIFCMDAGEVLADEDGYLPAGCSGDGIHLNVQYYEVWSKFICDNPVSMT